MSSPTELAAGLFLGSLEAAAGSDTFTHTLSACPLGACESAAKLAHSLLDVPEGNLFQLVDESIAFIAKALTSDGASKVLVCCQAGQSRSAALVLSFLIFLSSRSAEPLRLPLLVSWLRSVRPGVAINSGFLVQLHVLDALLQGSARERVVAAAQARLLTQACSRKARGATCAGLPLTAAEAEEAPSPELAAIAMDESTSVVWLGGVSSREVEAAAAAAAVIELPRADVRGWLERRLGEVRAGALGSGDALAAALTPVASALAEQPPARLWVRCGTCRAALASDAHLVGMPLSLADLLASDALPAASSAAGVPAAGVAATLAAVNAAGSSAASAANLQPLFCELLDWMVPSFLNRHAAGTGTGAAAGGAGAGAAAGASATAAPAAATAAEPAFADEAPPLGRGAARTFMPHVASRVGTGTSGQEPEELFPDYDVEGKLRCPCCGVKCGRFTWAGIWWTKDTPPGTSKPVGGGKGKGKKGHHYGYGAAPTADDCMYMCPAFALQRDDVRVTLA